jgi:hypothetical protein
MKRMTSFKNGKNGLATSKSNNRYINVCIMTAPCALPCELGLTAKRYLIFNLQQIQVQILSFTEIVPQCYVISLLLDPVHERNAISSRRNHETMKSIAATDRPRGGSQIRKSYCCTAAYEIQLSATVDLMTVTGWKQKCLINNNMGVAK